MSWYKTNHAIWLRFYTRNSFSHDAVVIAIIRYNITIFVSIAIISHTAILEIANIIQRFAWRSIK